MASVLWLPPTIEEDEEVAVEESEEEEEGPPREGSTVRKGRGKESVFVDEFAFPAEGGEKVVWEEEEVMEWARRSKHLTQTSLDSKILRAMEQRRQRKRERLQMEKEKETERSVGDDGDDDEEEEEEGEKDEEEEGEGGDNVTELRDKEKGRTGGEGDEDSEIELSDREETAEFFEEAPRPQTDVNFTDMNLSRPILKAVHAIGYESPTPIQAAAVPLALMGRDICACAATGTGKTAAFLLPILERLLFRPTHSQSTRILILTPTRELAIQIHSVGKALAKHTSVDFCLVTGGLDSRSQEAALRKNPDIVIATPGRLVDHLHNAPSFSLSSVEILVLDEADRMLDEHFKDQMEEVVQHCPKNRQTMLFSATMTDKVEELAAVSLIRPVRLFVDRNTDTADNLQQEFVRVRTRREGDREAIVTALCYRTFKDHCLLFLQTKRLAHRLRIIFGLLGLKSAELHGNLTQLQRMESLKMFKEGTVDFLLATDLAARGLDIKVVKTVINYNMPATVKHYIHRVGRTARAGCSGRSVTLVGENERKILKTIVKKAKIPAKSRVVPQEVVVRYRDRIRKVEGDIEAILKEEREEKELRLSEMEVNKARNMIEHEKEIFSRPPRTWLTNTRKRAADSLDKMTKNKKTKQDKDETPEEKKLRLEREHAIRVTKRQRKPKKIYSIAPDSQRQSSAKRKVKVQPVIAGFSKELTDTRRQAVRGFRKIPFQPKAKGSGFKSKKRYKRRK